MLIRFRTTFRAHGYDVTEPKLIACHYMKSRWFIPDLLSSVPFDRLIVSVSAGAMYVSAEGKRERLVAITWADAIALFRVFRMGRMVRKLSALNGANFLRVCYLMCARAHGLSC